MRIACSALLLTLCAGCVTVQRESFVRERAGEHVYPHPLSAVWPHVAALLVAQGYDLLPATRPDQLETEWKQEATCDGCAVTFSRYQAVGKEAQGRCIVRFVKALRTGGVREGTTQTANEASKDDAARETARARRVHQGTRTDDAGPQDGPVDLRSVQTGSHKGEKLSGARDLGMEWLLLQRVEPRAAAAIYQEAETRYR